MLRVLAALAAVAATLLLAACGGSEQASAPPADELAADDAFVVRIARHQQTGLALARSAATDADDASIRKLAQRFVSSREELMPALMERFAQTPERDRLADLGVTPAQAAEGIGPDALEGAQPLDPAFLTIMTEHNRGAIALSEAELDKGRDPAVKAVAQRIAANAAGELGSLTTELEAFARSR